MQGAAQAFGLLLHAHLGGTGACRECADIYHLPALEDYLVGARRYLGLRLLAAAFIEGVGRGIENAHDKRAGEVDEAATHIDCVLHKEFCSGGSSTNTPGLAASPHTARMFMPQLFTLDKLRNNI